MVIFGPPSRGYRDLQDSKVGIPVRNPWSPNTAWGVGHCSFVYIFSTVVSLSDLTDSVVFRFTTHTGGCMLETSLAQSD